MSAALFSATGVLSLGLVGGGGLCLLAGGGRAGGWPDWPTDVETGSEENIASAGLGEPGTQSKIR